MLKSVAIFSFSVLLGACSLEKNGTLYYHGKIYTMNDEKPVISSFIVRDGKFFIPDSNTTFQVKDSVDLEGKTIIPGFIDAHGHIASLGNSLMNVNVAGDSSIEIIQNKVKQFADEHQEMGWIRGRGWDQNLWKEKKFPTSEMLDQIVSDRPVVLGRVDGHAIWVNSKAMQLSEITNLTPDPTGGKIVRDETGKPTGVFVDNAKLLIEKYIPERDSQTKLTALKTAFHYLTTYGITGVHDAGVSLDDILLYKQNLDQDWFNLRVYAMVYGTSDAWDFCRKRGMEIGLNNYRLTIRSIKIVADGALGSRGAMLLDPYSDDPANKGLPVTSAEQIETIVKQAVQIGFQVNTHAIGDAAIREVLDSYEKYLPKDGINRRFRIEHSQIINLDDMVRYKKNNIIASMQPTHATSDMSWAEQRVGKERIKGAYAWRKFLDSGIHLAFGSDFPVESVNPLLGIYSAYTRQDLKGKPIDGWFADQRLTREEAVKGFTTWASYASFTEKLVGQIKTGQYADFITLSDNLFEVFPNEIPSITVEHVYFGGKKIK